MVIPYVPKSSLHNGITVSQMKYSRFLHLTHKIRAVAIELSEVMMPHDIKRQISECSIFTHIQVSELFRLHGCTDRSFAQLGLVLQHSFISFIFDSF